MVQPKCSKKIYTPSGLLNSTQNYFFSPTNSQFDMDMQKPKVKQLEPAPLQDVIGST
jgi:hypothetical protein